MIKVILALSKGIACAVAAGYVVSKACSAAGLPLLASPLIRSGLITSASLSAFMSYARFWIQGYWFDRSYPPRPDLLNKVAVVTGATPGGLGYASAEILARLGASVVVTARTEQKGNIAIQKLKEACGHDRVSFVVCDFAELNTVRSAAAALSSKIERLDYLVLNAGIAQGSPELIWKVNQIGPFEFVSQLTSLLETSARENGDVRVVAVSSGAHKRASINFEDPNQCEGAYGQSKLAQIMHMRELQRRMRTRPGLEGESRFRCISVTPGFVRTNLFKAPVYLVPLLAFLGRTPTVGAQVVKMACLGPDVPGGSYLSNCNIKPAEGKDGCANDKQQWLRLWALCEKCIAEQ